MIDDDVEEAAEDLDGDVCLCCLVPVCETCAGCECETAGCVCEAA